VEKKKTILQKKKRHRPAQEKKRSADGSRGGWGGGGNGQKKKGGKKDRLGVPRSRKKKGRRLDGFPAGGRKVPASRDRSKGGGKRTAKARGRGPENGPLSQIKELRVCRRKGEAGRRVREQRKRKKALRGERRKETRHPCEKGKKSLFPEEGKNHLTNPLGGGSHNMKNSVQSAKGVPRSLFAGGGIEIGKGGGKGGLKAEEKKRGGGRSPSIYNEDRVALKGGAASGFGERGGRI